MSQPIPIYRSDDPVQLGRSRAVEQVNTVEVQGAKEGLVVRPGEVLVLSFPGYTSVDELEIIRRSMMNAGLDGRFVLIGGQVNMSKVQPGTAASLGRALSSLEGEVLP